MDGAIDIRLIVTLLGVAASIFGGAAVAKMRIKDLQEAIAEIHATIKANDKRIDNLENAESVIKQRMGVLSSMLDPANMERRAREAERLRVEVDHLKQFRDSK
jgi:hypothetical protein